jgi:hypothetical protein
MLRQSFTLLALAIFCLATQANAQSTAYGYAYPQPQGGRASGLRVLNQASTAGEGWLRGQADWMRGYGDSLRSQAEADCFEQMAFEKQIQNYQRLRAPIEARREAKAKAAKAEAVVRQRENAARQYEANVAAQTLLSQIESGPAELEWPTQMNKPEFKQHLETINTCLDRWVDQQHALSRTDRSELRQSLEALQTYVRRQRLQNGPDAELAQARDLLQKIDTLVFSSRLPVEILVAQSSRH